MRFDLPEPLDKEGKPSFDELPDTLIKDIESVIGAPLLDARTVWGGYSAAFSIIAETDIGSFFIKGCHPQDMSHGAKNLEQEIFVYQNCDVLKDIAPAYIGQVEWGSEDDWRLGIWQAVPNAKIKTQWADEDYQAFVDTYKYLIGATCPVLNSAFENIFVKDIMTGQTGWYKFSTYEPRADEFAAAFENPQQAKDWLLHHLDSLIETAQKMQDHQTGILHFDIRTDNMLFDDQNRCWLIDWPNACTGPIGSDLVYLAGELSLRGNGPAKDIFEKICDLLNLKIPAEDIEINLAQLTGYCALNLYRASVDKMPRLRWLQKGMFCTLVGWMQQLEMVDSVPAFKKTT